MSLSSSSRSNLHQMGQNFLPWKIFTVLKGWVEGSYYNDKGGASNDLCLPEDPEYTDAAETKGFLGNSRIHVTEYHRSRVFDNSGLRNQNGPC